MSTLEDFLYVKEKMIDGTKFFELQLALTLIQPAMTYAPKEIRVDIVKQIKADMKAAYVNRVLQLSFQTLEKHKLRGVKFAGYDIIITPTIRRSVIVLHPETFFELFNNFKGLVKEVEVNAEETEDRENTSC